MCGFTTSNIQRGAFRCSSSSQSAVIYRAEIYDTPQANLSQLLSLLGEWISKEPSFLVQSQLVSVGSASDCSMSVSSLSEELCGKDSSQTMTSFNTYIIVGVTGGVALILTVSVIMMIAILAIMISRHRKTVKLSSTRYISTYSIMLSSNHIVFTLIL